MQTVLTESSCVLDAKAECGECPVWVPEEGVLYWTDIPGRTLNRFDPASGHNQVWRMPEEVGCFALREGGGMVAALRSGFAFIDLERGFVEHIADPESDKPENRFNDGRCDAAGRFWAGTMHEPRTEKAGALYRFDEQSVWKRMASGFMVSNGLAWSPDNRRMYHSDSRGPVIWVYDYDIEHGEIANRRVFAVPTPEQGRPDGAAVDSDGCYWSAGIGGGRVIRYTPGGRIDTEILLPVQKVTMCAFGGENLDVLYVTTAREELSPTELAAQPSAGGIFAVHVGAQGLVEPRFKG